MRIMGPHNYVVTAFGSRGLCTLDLSMQPMNQSWITIQARGTIYGDFWASLVEIIVFLSAAGYMFTSFDKVEMLFFLLIIMRYMDWPTKVGHTNQGSNYRGCGLRHGLAMLAISKGDIQVHNIIHILTYDLCGQDHLIWIVPPLFKGIMFISKIQIK